MQRRRDTSAVPCPPAAPAPSVLPAHPAALIARLVVCPPPPVQANFFQADGNIMHFQRPKGEWRRLPPCLRRTLARTASRSAPAHSPGLSATLMPLPPALSRHSPGCFPRQHLRRDWHPPDQVCVGLRAEYEEGAPRNAALLTLHARPPLPLRSHPGAAAQHPVPDGP